MPGWGGSGKYNLTPYRQFDQDCREALFEYVDFKENPEKYHPNFIRTAYTHMIDSCMNSSIDAFDPNYKMHPLVVEMLKENGCAQGKTDVDIIAISPDYLEDNYLNFLNECSIWREYSNHNHSFILYSKYNILDPLKGFYLCMEILQRLQRRSKPNITRRYVSIRFEAL